MSCGAGSRAAPYVPSGYAETECGSLDTVAPNLLKAVRSGGFDGLAEVIQQELIPSNTLRVALGGVLRLAKAAPPPPGLLEPLGKLIDNNDVEPVVTLVLRALQFIAGRSPAVEAHYQVTTVVGRLIGECDPKGVLTFGEVLLKTRLPLGCTVGSPGCQLGTIALLRPVRDLLADPAMRELVSSLAIESIPEDSFVALANLIVSTLKSPSFQFTEVRAVIQQNVYPLIKSAPLKTKLDVVLDVLEQLTKPEVGLQDSLRETLSCVTVKDPNSEIVRMAYALIVQPEFQFAELLTAAASTEDIDPDERVAQWLSKVIGLLKSDRALNNALIGVGVQLLQEKNAQRVIPGLLDIASSGVFNDLQKNLEQAFDTCSKEAIP
jgi:hypothetical protein